LLVTGGPPTADKPTVSFAAPADPDRVSHSMTIRVPDARGAFETLRGRGAVFLAEPVESDWEIRAFFRDPDGHLLEVSEAKSARS
jgi:catechol 2,3-dioxygenase-like lactoylglutathione lyase family enzyme